MQHTRRASRYLLPVLLLTVLTMASFAASATQYQGTVPGTGDGVPGAYVRYVDLKKGDELDWSWKADTQLDFRISIPSTNETLVKQKETSSMGGSLHAEQSGVYRFAWYNAKAGDDVELDYTIHQVQSQAWVLGLASLAVIAIVVFAFILWYHRQRADSLAEALDDMVEETGQLPPATGPRKVTNRAILVGVVAGLVTVSVISGLFLPLEEVEATPGSQLLVRLDNGGNSSLSVTVTLVAPDGSTVQEESLQLDPGETGPVLLMAYPDLADQVLTVHVDDGTGGPTVDRDWTPTLDQRDVMDIQV